MQPDLHFPDRRQSPDGICLACGLTADIAKESPLLRFGIHNLGRASSFLRSGWFSEDSPLPLYPCLLDYTFQQSGPEWGREVVAYLANTQE